MQSKIWLILLNLNETQLRLLHYQLSSTISLRQWIHNSNMESNLNLSVGITTIQTPTSTPWLATETQAWTGERAILHSQCHMLSWKRLKLRWHTIMRHRISKMAWVQDRSIKWAHHEASMRNRSWKWSSKPAPIWRSRAKSRTRRMPLPNQPGHPFSHLRTTPHWCKILARQSRISIWAPIHQQWRIRLSISSYLLSQRGSSTSTQIQVPTSR